MLDKELWEIAQKQAQKEYEKEYGCWDEADKDERADWVFSAYMKLKDNAKGGIKHDSNN